MKILILGAGGFIGKNLITKLYSDEKNIIYAFDRKGIDYSACVADDSRFFRVEADTWVDYDFDKLTENIDIVYHLISTSNPARPESMLGEVEDNIIPTIKLLDSCVRNKVKKFVFISSGGTVYGILEDIPVTEEHKTDPICEYGIQKLTLEKIVALYGYKYGLKYNILRLSNPFGPYQNPKGGQGAVTTFIYNVLCGLPIKVYGDGSVTRDYIYIADAVEKIVKVVSDFESDGVYNIGSGIGRSIKQIIDSIGEAAEAEPLIEYMPGREVDVPINVLSIDKYRCKFKDNCTDKFDDGIMKTIEFMRENYDECK